jgi:hypothetical protein
LIRLLASQSILRLSGDTIDDNSFRSYPECVSRFVGAIAIRA